MTTGVEAAAHQRWVIGEGGGGRRRLHDGSVNAERKRRRARTTSGRSGKGQHAVVAGGITTDGEMRGDRGDADGESRFTEAAVAVGRTEGVRALNRTTVDVAATAVQRDIGKGGFSRAFDADRQRSGTGGCRATACSDLGVKRLSAGDCAAVVGETSRGARPVGALGLDAEALNADALVSALAAWWGWINTGRLRARVPANGEAGAWVALLPAICARRTEADFRALGVTWEAGHRAGHRLGCVCRDISKQHVLLGDAEAAWNIECDAISICPSVVRYGELNLSIERAVTGARLVGDEGLGSNRHILRGAGTGAQITGARGKASDAETATGGFSSKRGRRRTECCGLEECAPVPAFARAWFFVGRRFGRDVVDVTSRVVLARVVVKHAIHSLRIRQRGCCHADVLGVTALPSGLDLFEVESCARRLIGYSDATRIERPVRISRRTWPAAPRPLKASGAVAFPTSLHRYDLAVSSITSLLIVMTGSGRIRMTLPVSPFTPRILRRPIDEMDIGVSEFTEGR